MKIASRVFFFDLSSRSYFQKQNLRKGGTASLRSRKCVKRNAVFGARFKSESGQGGWKTQRGGKHTVNSAKNPSPKTFLDPHLRYVSPPPFFWRLSVISLKKKEAPTRPTPTSEASKSGFGEHTLQYVFPPPNTEKLKVTEKRLESDCKGQRSLSWSLLSHLEALFVGLLQMGV